MSAENTTPEFWESNFVAKKEMWGLEPSRSAELTHDFFVAKSVKTVLVPGIGWRKLDLVIIECNGGYEVTINGEVIPDRASLERILDVFDRNGIGWGFDQRYCLGRQLSMLTAGQGITRHVPDDLTKHLIGQLPRPTALCLLTGVLQVASRDHILRLVEIWT